MVPLFIYGLMYFSLCVGILCLSLFCYGVTLCLFYFCNRLEAEENAGCFAFVGLPMSCKYKCSAARPSGAGGWPGLQCAIVVYPLIILTPCQC